MFNKLLELTGLKGLVLKVILLGVVVGSLAFWINWSFEKQTEVTNQATEITRLNGEIKKLTDSIDDYTNVKKKIKVNFDEIEQSQIDLLCAARYDAKAPPPVAPQIVEVVKYRDRVTQCPTTDPEKAELFDPAVSAMRPVNDEIAAQVLNNSWRAYCTATNNEDTTCAPFR
jgi:hypothetical protein